MGPIIEEESDETETETIRHTYYQWVQFVLFFQGAMFYFPHYLWKTIEGQRLDDITSNLRSKTVCNNQPKDNCEILVQYLKETFHMHRWYMAAYVLCNLMNFVNVIGQMYFINFFLGGAFLTYGTEVLNWTKADAEQRTDPMIEVFPRITKCTFHKYAPTGMIEQHDAMCILATNAISEKIYVVLWFWLIILAVITALYLIYVSCVILVPSMRRTMLKRKAKGNIKEHIDILLREADIGDWFVLFLLSKNIDSSLFKEILISFSELIDQQKSLL